MIESVDETRLIWSTQMCQMLSRSGIMFLFNSTEKLMVVYVHCHLNMSIPGWDSNG